MQMGFSFLSIFSAAAAAAILILRRSVDRDERGLSRQERDSEE